MNDTVNITAKSLGLIKIVEFFFPDYQNDSFFIDACSGLNGTQIREFMSAHRKNKINETRFDSVECFVDTYELNITAALEQLFQERIEPSQFEKLKCSDPVVIFNFHQQDPYIKFNAFTAYFL